MCVAIAVVKSELPQALVAQHRLAERVYARAGREEYQFHWWQAPTVLPVQREGKLELLQWGSKSRRGPLPYGGWISRADIGTGLLANACPQEVVIPANLGLQKGTWFVINQGIHGVAILVRGRPIVYMLMEPSTNYFRNMTEQTAMMPVFVDQVI
jgi:hypothetical protein